MHFSHEEDRTRRVVQVAGSEVAQWHNRQLVALEPEACATWLDPSRPYDHLVKPPKAGGILQAVQVPIRQAA